jgi:hypothetical protein
MTKRHLREPRLLYHLAIRVLARLKMDGDDVELDRIVQRPGREASPSAPADPSRCSSESDGNGFPAARRASVPSPVRARSRCANGPVVIAYVAKLRSAAGFAHTRSRVRVRVGLNSALHAEHSAAAHVAAT